MILFYIIFLNENKLSFEETILKVLFCRFEIIIIIFNYRTLVKSPQYISEKKS